MVASYCIKRYIKETEGLKDDKELMYLISKYERTTDYSAPDFTLYKDIDDYKNELKKDIKMYTETGTFRGHRVGKQEIECSLFDYAWFPGGELIAIKEMHIILFDEPIPEFDYDKYCQNGYGYYNDIINYISYLKKKIKLQTQKEDPEIIAKRKNSRKTIEKIIQNDTIIQKYKMRIEETGNVAPEYDYNKYCYYEGIEKYRKYLAKIQKKCEKEAIEKYALLHNL